jgi:Tol biopolymer transport system component
VRLALTILAACLVAGCGAARNGTGGAPSPADPGLIVIAGVLDLAAPVPPGWKHPPVAYYALQPGGGEIRKLAFADSDRDLGFSADGRWAAMTATDDKLIIARFDGSDRRSVPLPGNGYPASPSLSPDGKHVAFAYTEGTSDRTDLWTVAADGRDPSRLKSPGNVLSVAWSPDGSRIAFVDGSQLADGSDGAVGELYVVDSDGSDLRRVAPAFTGLAFEVVWSPDGKRIAFEDERQRLVTADADGANVSVVSRQGQAPAWSPDGKELAFLRVTACQSYLACSRGRILVADLETGTVREVGPKFGAPITLSWTIADLWPRAEPTKRKPPGPTS